MERLQTQVLRGERQVTKVGVVELGKLEHLTAGKQVQEHRAHLSRKGRTVGFLYET